MDTSVGNSSKKTGSVLSVSSYMTKKVEKFRFIINNITSLLIAGQSIFLLYLISDTFISPILSENWNFYWKCTPLKLILPIQYHVEFQQLLF
jgi:hypothetical protein